jgi:ribosomal protein S18 acetylase RimI-like enzyme
MLCGGREVGVGWRVRRAGGVGRRRGEGVRVGAEPDGVTIRPIDGPEELGLFRRLSYVLDEELADDLAEGRRRPEWMWVALCGEELLARVAWWTGSETPSVLDVFDLDDRLASPERLEIGERLVRTALARVVPFGRRPPEYLRYVAPDWREGEAGRRAVRDRMAVLERLGARPLVERLRLLWRAGTAVPEPSGRLAFRVVRDRAEIVGLMTAALEGTLDAHSRRDLTSRPPEEVALRHYEDELDRYTSPRQWWRVATLPDGDPVGFVIPARNAYNPIIAYLAVLPAHRGRGYVDDILAEGTRVLAAAGVPHIRAATDLTNKPMAEAFHRAGYAAFEHTITMVWS